MPREAEAHPKPSWTPKGGGGEKCVGGGAGWKRRDVEKVVYWLSKVDVRTPSLTAGLFGASAAQKFAFSSDQIVTRGAVRSLTRRRRCCSSLCSSFLSPTGRGKHRNLPEALRRGRTAFLTHPLQNRFPEGGAIITRLSFSFCLCL